MERDKGSAVLATIIGAAAGAITALLFAPSSGQETRRRLVDQFSSTKERARDAAGRAAGRMREWRAARPMEMEGKIDLNNATREELMEIPGIGPSTADDIIRYREAHGGFESIDELENVYGFGSSTVEKLRENAYI